MADNSNRSARSEAEKTRQQGDELAATADRATNETTRVAREATDRFSQTADSAANTGAYVADQAARAAGEIRERASDLARKNVENIQKGVENSLDMTSRMAERSISLFAGAAGVPTEQAKEAADHSLRNIRAIVESGSVLLNAYQQAGRDWLDRTKEQMQRDVDAIDAVLRSRTISELAQAQTNLARTQLERLITASQHTTELVGRAAGDALQRIKEADREPAEAA